MILIVVPEVCRTGGVQAFSAEVIDACANLIGPSDVAIFSRNDRTSDLRERWPEFACTSGLGFLPKLARKMLAKPFVHQMVRRLKPQVIICTHPQVIPFVSETLVPVLGVCHGIDAWSLSHTLKGHLRQIRRLLAVSRFTRDQLIQQAPDLASKLFVFPNTFDDRRYCLGERSLEFRRRLHIPDDAFVLLSIARLALTEVHKGYDDVIRSLPLILAARPDSYFVLGGRGDDLSRVQRLAEELGVIDHCRFPGFVENSDLPYLYRAADLFVLPSRKEGFGIVFIEAIACGIPVIAGNADGSRDAVLDGMVGTLVTPGDQSELIKAILGQMNRPIQAREEEQMQYSQRIVHEFGRHRFQDRLQMHLADLGVLCPEKSGEK